MADATKIGVADATKMGVANARVANATQPSLSMRAFAIDEPGSPVRALYATLDGHSFFG